jgi:hypothetical protein
MESLNHRLTIPFHTVVTHGSFCVIQVEGASAATGQRSCRRSAPSGIAAGAVFKPGQCFGFHSLRHSLATFLTCKEQDTKTVKGLFRHANVSTTLSAVRAEREFVNGGGAGVDAEGDFSERVGRSARVRLLNLSLPNAPDVYAGRLRSLET